MVVFRNENIPKQVCSMSYNYSGGMELELTGLTPNQVQNVFNALNNEDNYNFDPNNIKIIFSGPKTICIDKKTGRKTMITYSGEDSIYLNRASLISLVLIKHILYGQNRKKEYTKFCSKLYSGIDVYMYLEGLIGIDNVEQFFVDYVLQFAE